MLLGAAPHHFPLPVTRGLTGDPKPGKWHIHLTAEIKKKKEGLWDGPKRITVSKRREEKE